MIYHLVPARQVVALCELYGRGTVAPDDHLVGEDEARDPDRRHFNCPECDKALHYGQAHVAPPEGSS